MRKHLKLLAIILTASIAFSFTATANTYSANGETPSASFGDVTLDGKVSLLDSAYIFFSKLGLVKLSDVQLSAADVNTDGTVDFDDMREITEVALGLSSTFTVEENLWPTIFEDMEYLELQKDADGNNIYMVNKSYEVHNIVNSDTICIKATDIKYSAKSDSKEVMYCNAGIKKNQIYLEASIKQLGKAKLGNLLTFRVIKDNENEYLVVPTINAYMDAKELELDFSNFYDFLNISETADYEFASTYYSESYKFTYGGTEYICEEYKTYWSTYRDYFTTDGKYVRSETISNIFVGDYSIYLYDFLGPEIDEEMLEIPPYYFEISLSDLADFINKNQSAEIITNAFNIDIK